MQLGHSLGFETKHSNGQLFCSVKVDNEIQMNLITTECYVCPSLTDALLYLSVKVTDSTNYPCYPQGSG